MDIVKISVDVGFEETACVVLLNSEVLECFSFSSTPMSAAISKLKLLYEILKDKYKCAVVFLIDEVGLNRSVVGFLKHYGFTVHLVSFDDHGKKTACKD